jgi:hypothetical protein
MISWLRRQFADHPVRTVTLAYVLLTLVLCNVKLFAPGGPWWRGWGDQKAYLESAQALWAFDLDPAHHWYPLLYPLLGAPFAGVSAVPFLPANIACFALAFWGFQRVCARFDVPAAGAALLFFATTLAPGIAGLWVEPWSTTVSAALIWMALALVGDFLAGEGGREKAALFGALLALIVAARPADAAVAAVILPFAVWRPLVRERRFGLLVPGLGAGLAVLAAYALLFLSIHPGTSDYIELSRAYGLNPADLGFKAFVLLVEPRGWFGTGEGLLAAMPWLIFGAAGLILALRRPLAACLALAALVNVFTILTYVDMLPTGLWRYHNIHYFKWLWPLFGLGTLLFVRVFRSDWRPATAVLAGLVLLSGFRADRVPVAADAPARALEFDAAGLSEGNIYMAPSAIVDVEGPLRNKFEYRQLSIAPGRARAVSVRRDFAGSEQWWPAVPSGMVKDVADRPSPPLTSEFPRDPLARYGERWNWGYPCWLPPRGCAGP